MLLGAAALGVACGDSDVPSTPDAPSGPQCSDGVDNDGDGQVDYPDDLGCTDANDDTEDSAAQPQCDDGRDNDGDGKTDYPADPGCFASLADSEEDDCPSGPNCPQCGNGVDDDGNGSTDYPDDPGCVAASDPFEFTENPVACGANLMIKNLPPTGMEEGMLATTSTSELVPSCGGVAGAPAIAYQVSLTEPKVMVANTNGSAVNTVLSLRNANCTDDEAEIACHDDVSTSNRSSTITASLAAGNYYLIVSGATATATGAYTLDIKFFTGEGETCAATEECGPGLVCRTPAGETEMQCAPPVCSDGRDDDADGKVDFPEDPGCDSPTDDDEADDCPDGTSCPQCGNGVDDDEDGLTDYPDDPSCTSASASSESCLTTEGVVELVSPMTNGSTTGATHDVVPSCNSSNTARDLTYRLDVPTLTAFQINLTNLGGFDSVGVLYDASCTGTQLKCSDAANMNVGPVAAGTYYFVVDGWNSNSGNFTINVIGTIANGESCEAPLAQSGALTCATGYSCQGTVGSRTCQPTACNNGTDDDGDGKADFPEDPGCLTPSDDDETDDCPSGPSCPVCANGVDDDGDGLTDYPDDPGCSAASGDTEECAGEQDPIVMITTANTPGNLSGASADLTISCGSPTNPGPNLVYLLQIPDMASLRLDTQQGGLDTAMALLPSSCTGAEIACNDDGFGFASPSLIELTNVTGGTYAVSVNAYAATSTTGPFTLRVGGVIQNGASCESPLAQSGALRCDEGYACQGTAGSRTCQPAACNDGTDNDGDGKADYPLDPGCTSISDADEEDDCPSGPNCAVCSNGIDDDMDGFTDYPDDTGCSSAAGETETGCPQESDPYIPVTMPTYNGDTTGATNDFSSSMCYGSTSGMDVLHTLVLPVPVATLDIFVGGPLDYIIGVRDETCGSELICADAGIANDEEIHMTNVAPGAYQIVIDAWGGASAGPAGPYTLEVHGTVAAGTACDSPLFAAGVLSCPSGTSCGGSPMVCQ